MLKAARAELLDAQRREEAANKMCEAEGQNIFRPSEWPIPVMLEIERDDAPKTPAPVAPPKPDVVAPPKPEVPKAAADAALFEGADE